MSFRVKANDLVYAAVDCVEYGGECHISRKDLKIIADHVNRLMEEHESGLQRVYSHSESTVKWVYHSGNIKDTHTALLYDMKEIGSDSTRK